MKTRTKSADILTKWSIDYFPFSSIYPENSGINIPAFSDPAVELTTGITSISITRSKGTVASQCVFSITGEGPDNLFPGTWIVIKSTGQNAKGEPLTLMRFIGQVHSMTVDYSVSPDTALIQTRITYHAREWSAALETPVRYDMAAIAQTLDQTGVMMLNIQSINVSYGQIKDLVKNSFNAFELAQLILMMVGSLSANDKVSKLSGINIALPEIATRMPTVPKSLIDYLEMSGVDAKGAFATGFVKVITGIQKKGVNNKGDWSGIWDTTSVNSYANDFIRNDPEKPIALGYAALSSMGDSAWNLITNHCDPSINEFFTDIFYEKVNDKIISRPFIMIRDKPFLLKMFKDAMSIPSGKWTIYDDLPRTRIDSVYIQSFQFQNTFVNSPNYIRVNFSPQSVESDLPKAASLIAGFKQINAEMNRFGGQEYSLETQFLNIDTVAQSGASGTKPDWFAQLAQISMAWHSYNYKMGSGSLFLRDDNVPITCGTNVQFSIGDFELVGHVEAYEIQAVVHADGRHETTSRVQLSRIVQEIDKKLDFIPPDSMTKLLNTKPYTIPSNFSSLLSNIVNMVDM